MPPVPTRRANGSHSILPGKAIKTMYRTGRAEGHASVKP
ncbi:hypothetical protein ABIB94_008722 [Bradyrhizobium sp. JR7.2]